MVKVRARYKESLGSPKRTRMLWKQLAEYLIKQERFETTLKRARHASRRVDHLVSVATRITRKLEKQERPKYSMRGLLMRDLFTKEAFNKLVHELVPRFRNVRGSVTRVLRTGVRRGRGFKGDCAEMAVVELIDTHKTILSPDEMELRNLRRLYNHQRRTNLDLNEGLRLALERKAAQKHIVRSTDPPLASESLARS
ncbi:50S ribosomal protein L17 [Porphyridium purpureum]|uniref:50S ribosomal protein L17 n=1 Tax=Porphyridium purpureum TaxID=35688 RepID=A0A5J4YQI7_PORPP|nr:50S ribosomal protein L17 [Porphyridium purpureum]|eukprot:POR3841..scf236_6